MSPKCRRDTDTRPAPDRPDRLLNERLPKTPRANPRQSGHGEKEPGSADEQVTAAVQRYEVARVVGTWLDVTTQLRHELVDGACHHEPAMALSTVATLRVLQGFTVPDRASTCRRSLANRP